MKTHLSVEMAAEHVGVSPWLLKKLRLQGTGPAYLKIGRSARYTEEDLDAWLAQQRVEPKRAKVRRLPMAAELVD